MLDLNEYDTEAGFEDDVKAARYKVQVSQEAARREAAESGRFLPFSAITNVRPEPVDLEWCVEGLIPADGHVLIKAKRKAGKTTMIGNLVNSLITGDRFLNEFKPDRRYRVALLDTEMSENQHVRWLNDLGIRENPRLFTGYYRGNAQSIPLFDDKRRHELAEYLSDLGIEVLIVDPLGPLLRAYGIDENDNTLVGRAVDYLKKLKEEANIEVLIVTHHEGKDSSNSARGASVLEDSPDVIWSLVGPRDQPADKLLAFGRDVDEVRGLDYDKETRHLKAVREEDIVQADNKVSNQSVIIHTAMQAPGLSGSQLYKASRASGFTGNEGAFYLEIRKLVANGSMVNEGTESRPKWTTPITDDSEGCE